MNAGPPTPPVAQTFESAALPGRRLLQGWRRLSPAWRWALGCFLAGRVLYSGWGAILWALGFGIPGPEYLPLYFDIQPLLDGPAGAFLGMWQRWDTLHYLRIATGGYTATDLSAFYPLYPLLGSWLSQISGLPALPALLVISNLAFLYSLVLLYQIACRFFSEDVARNALVTALIFPTSFYFYAAYPQSLLLMLILLAFWLALQRRWLAVAGVNLLAGLVHSTAVLLVVLVGWQVIQFLRTRPGKWALAALVAPFTNLLGVALFLAWREAHGFMPYTVLQEQWFGRTFELPWTALANFSAYVAHLPLRITYLIPWITVLGFLLAAGLTIANFNRIPWPMWFYQAGLLLFLLGNHMKGAPLLAFLRYALIMFPLFYEIGAMLRTRLWKLALFSLGVLLSLLCSAMFFLWRGDMI